MVSRIPPQGSIPPEGDPAGKLLDDIRSRLGEQDFATWFCGISCEFQPPHRFVIIARNKFQAAWIEKNFRDCIRAAARGLFEIDVQIEISYPQGSRAKPPPVSRASDRDPRPAAPPAARQDRFDGSSPVPFTTRRDLNSQFLFDHFVVGPSNRVAQVAAIAVCDELATSYNPLFIHGESGIGKTHLLHAICHRLLETRRSRILFLSAEEFVNQFIASVTDGRRTPVRGRCLEADLVVLDDIHFLSGKERTQDELFHTFNALMEAKRQVILSGRCAPRQTLGLQERLASRFQAGLVARIDSPGFELRVAILLRKAHLHGITIPAEVAEFLADRIRSNVHELEGALARVASLASLRRSTIDLDIARTSLRSLEIEVGSSGLVTMAQILQALQEYYHLKPKELLARSKARSIVLPRQIGMVLARELTQLSLEEIGMHFGGRDHTTVLYAQDRIAALRKTSPQVRTDIQILRSRLSTGRGSSA